MSISYDPTTLAKRLSARPQKYGAIPVELKDELILELTVRFRHFEALKVSDIAKEFLISRQTAREVINTARIVCRSEKGYMDPGPPPGREKIMFEVYTND